METSQNAQDNDGFSLFHQVLGNNEMPQEERSEDRLAKEAQTLLGGGTASTARTIGFASYYILSRSDVRERLHAELSDVMASWPQRIPTWVELEKVSYLQAIIKESLR